MNASEIQSEPIYSFLTLIIATVILLTARNLWKESYTNNKKLHHDDEKLPPLTETGSSFQTIRLFVNNELPFILLNYSRQLKSSIFRIQLPANRLAVVVGDAAIARRVLNDPNNIKTPAYRWMERIAGGPNFFSAADGPRVAHVRRSVLPAFAPARIERMVDLCRVRVDEWAKSTFEPLVESGEPFDVALNMKRFTTKFIVEAAFGYVMTDREVDTVLDSFDVCCAAYVSTMALSLPRLIFGRLHPGVRRAKQAALTLQSFASRLLKSHRENPNSPDGTVIALIDADKDYKSDKERERDLLVFLFGGYETTAVTLSFALLELAQNPIEQTRLYENLKAQNTGSGKLRSLMLQNVINETLRLHPAPAVASIRKLVKDFQTGPYIIPSGSSVCISSFLIHRNIEVYDDPDSFKPSRWETADGKGHDISTDESSDFFLPFGSGRRSCIGRALASAELDVILSELCTKYEFIVVEKGTCTYCVTHKTSGTQLKVKRRR